MSSSPYNRRHPTLGRVPALVGEEDFLSYRDTAPTGLLWKKGLSRV
ncbi:MAG: hypothetical protein IPN36_11955 [Bacteroidetes bacterium]|nr:hypothetical protein [Bacteroidota bacterium]